MPRGEDTRNHPNRRVGRSMMTQYGISEEEASAAIDYYRMNRDEGKDLEFYPQEDWKTVTAEERAKGYVPRPTEGSDLAGPFSPKEMVTNAVKNRKKSAPVNDDDLEMGMPKSAPGYDY